MRTKNSLINISVGMIGRILDLLISFITRAVFLRFLSLQFLGITGLFTNILSVLNLAELGVGAAIIYALYAPLAEIDEEKIKSLMHLYKKAYFIIGLVVLAIGIAILPFLDMFIKEKVELVDIRIIFSFYILQSVASYWFFAYKSALLDADQKKYIVSIASYSVAVIGKIIQIVILYAFQSNPVFSFYLYTLFGVFINITYNLIIALITDKIYPFLKDKTYNKLTEQETKQIVKNIYGLTLYKVSTTVNSAADNIIISSFIGVTLVGLFSNYTTILNAVRGVMITIFQPIIASIGNLYVKESKDKTERFFYALHFASFWIYGLSSICLFILMNYFIRDLWLGSDYLLSTLTVFVIVLNFLVDGLMNAPITYRNACGLFWNSRYRAVLATIVNVFFSILFVTKFQWGIPGVIFATIISRIGVTLWFDPYVVYHNIFLKSPMIYYFRYFRDLVIILLTGALTYWISMLIDGQGLLHFIYITFISFTLPNVLWWILFRKTEEFDYFKKLLFHFLKKFETIRNM